MIVNRAQLAELFGISTPKVDRLVKRGAPYLTRPVDGKGQWAFNPAAVLRWELAQLGSPEDAQDREAKRARARNAVAVADLRELELETKSRQYVRIEDVVPIIEASENVVKEEALALPERLGPLVAAETDPTKIQAMLKGGVSDVLEAICERVPVVLQQMRDDLPAE